MPVDAPVRWLGVPLGSQCCSPARLAVPAYEEGRGLTASAVEAVVVVERAVDAVQRLQNLRSNFRIHGKLPVPREPPENPEILTGNPGGDPGCVAHPPGHRQAANCDGSAADDAAGRHGWSWDAAAYRMGACVAGGVSVDVGGPSHPVGAAYDGGHGLKCRRAVGRV